jgi:hypothetical protein
MIVWQANNEVKELIEQIKQKNHCPRLSEAKIAICFNDGKMFVKNRFNWGKVQKFSNLAKLWHHPRHDFLINVPGDIWTDILNENQREALVDLHLSRCGVEYEPETIEENGTKKVVKDEWGRVEYTDIIKTDDEGNPKWLVYPFDLEVISSNIGRYGLWCEGLADLKTAIETSSKVVE